LAVVTVLLEIFAPQVIGIFNKSPELLAIAVPGMRIFLSALVLIGPAIMFIITFQGLSKGWTAICLSLVRQLALLLPALLILPRLHGVERRLAGSSDLGCRWCHRRRTMALP
jgi:Na+-driven multidrug efflux pump